MVLRCPAQLRHYLELAELRRTVLQYASVELGVLLQEEALRAFAAPTKVPKDSKFRCAACVCCPDHSKSQVCCAHVRPRAGGGTRQKKALQAGWAASDMGWSPCFGCKARR